MNELESRGEGSAATAQVQQFLTFALGAEEYGIDVLKVQEIKAYAAITAIPNTPAYIKGVMNLRGAIVPIVDLRARFGLPEVEYTKYTVIIVIRVGQRIGGLIVDAVSDVLSLAADQIEAPPELGGSAETSFMTGMAKSNDKLVQIIEVERLLGHSDVGAAPRAS